MTTRRELTKAYARGYQPADKKTKGVTLDELVAGGTPVGAIRQASLRKGRAGET